MWHQKVNGCPGAKSEQLSFNSHPQKIIPNLQTSSPLEHNKNQLLIHGYQVKVGAQSILSGSIKRPQHFCPPHDTLSDYYDDIIGNRYIHQQLFPALKHPIKFIRASIRLLLKFRIVSSTYLSPFILRQLRKNQSEVGREIGILPRSSQGSMRSSIFWVGRGVAEGSYLTIVAGKVDRIPWISLGLERIRQGQKEHRGRKDLWTCALQRMGG